MTAAALVTLPQREHPDRRPRHHLLGRLSVLEARVAAAVARRHQVDRNPTDGFRGLYLTREHIEATLTRPQPLDATDPDAAELLRAVEADADAAEARGDDVRLRRLARSFDLEPLDVEILLVALAPDLDARFERLYGYLHDDVSRRRASVGLSIELCGAHPTDPMARARFAAGAQLRAGRLVIIEEEDRPFLTRSLRVPDRVAAHLLGDDGIDPLLVQLLDARVQPVSERPACGDSFKLPRRAVLGYVRDCPASGGVDVALAALADRRPRAIAVSFERLPADADIPEVARVLHREVRLLDAAIAASALEQLAARGNACVRPFTELACPVVLMGTAPWDPAWSSRVPVVWQARRLTNEERSEIWAAALGDCSAVDAARGTGAFRLGAEQIQRAATAARLRADAAGRAPVIDDLRFGARTQNAAALDRLARRIDPAVRFDSLVLPDEQMQLLRDIVVRAEHRETVFDTWKVGGVTAGRRGLTALFTGPSGTGKSMSAEVIAAELGLDLYAIDLATVVDKYIGETEKNLDRVFRESERLNCVLLFDEADALFGKRSGVSDAHDRYANVETAYLLQRMEQFEGIAILATNLRANLDEAFSRRLDVIVDFPDPDEAQRLLLWERCLASGVPRAGDVDLPTMARSFKLSGGNIRNVTVSAAFLAAARGGALTMADLLEATHREYRKLGRLFLEDSTPRSGI